MQQSTEPSDFLFYHYIVICKEKRIIQNKKGNDQDRGDTVLDQPSDAEKQEGSLLMVSGRAIATSSGVITQLSVIKSAYKRYLT